ncbi:MULTISPECIES: asparagine synthase (glutamine-hydrolyzing) [unclassified Pseudoalteromonas]|uniref:asparagine synthase (glutamine-hydrolyzing) n=1 Tax=unclassified Pseudoalteromonas TaxID=194690 RepID=UPI002097E0C9|nr:asparagine synthase (glutamine-hydrolyzing) [Pseudoalteromonas sp. XMcav2-N]MCO7188408.1 asparagine synthase (glutamine-hydrolyzing) [Pseudoalteromonas sp. XMcav2-N]
MCGISGTYSFDGHLDRTNVSAMHDMLTHRGPDETYSLDTHCVSAKLGRLGMNGLATGWQPAHDSTQRYVALTNGEIYNAQTLIDELELTIPDGNAVDVAIIPELISRFGIDGLKKVDGQFACMVFDKQERRLILARDRFGVCPLYYAVLGNKVHFCSELKPIVRTVNHRWQLDATAVDQYFNLGNVVAPNTLVSDVKAVEPGCAVLFDVASIDVHRYWRFGEFDVSDSPVDPEQLHETVKRSVADRLHSEVEIGSYLSGGFDSSAILADASALSESPIKTFSVTFDEPGLDESKFQRTVSDAMHSIHHEVVCSKGDIGRRFEEMVRHCCFPQRETYNVAALMLSESVQLSGVKGVLSGEGADELFFGYDSYIFDSLAKNKTSESMVNEQAWGRADFSWEVDPIKVQARKEVFLSQSMQDAIKGNEYWRKRLIPYSESELKGLSKMQLRSIADVYVQLSGHLLGDHGDAMVMANSIEGRYPFLGNSVVAMAMNISDAQKVANFEGKACLRKAYDQVLPREVLTRAKQGFTAYDLVHVVDDKTWSRWRELTHSAGIFNNHCMDNRFSNYREEKWDFRLASISLAIIIDELGLHV